MPVPSPKLPGAVLLWGLALLSFCLLLASTLAIWLPTLRGGSALIDGRGYPLGGDFSQYYAASAVALSHGGEHIFNETLYRDTYEKVIGIASTYRWVYPPSFLLVVVPLALLPYGFALALWLSLTFCLYLGITTRIYPHFQGLALSLALPAVFFNLIYGQNGFLTAGLYGAGLLLLPARPWLAGLVLGCLSLKPHLALLLPLALGAAGERRALAGAGLSAAAWVAASSLAFGWSLWPQFLNSVGRSLGSLGNATLHLEHMVSLYAALRLAGLGAGWAFFLQGLVSTASALGVFWLWRRRSRAPLRYSVLVVGSLLATPHIFFYDLCLLALPLAWLAMEGRESGWLRGEVVILVLGWLLPLVAYVSQKFCLGLPAAPLILLLLFLLPFRRHVFYQEIAREQA